MVFVEALAAGAARCRDRHWRRPGDRHAVVRPARSARSASALRPHLQSWWTTTRNAIGSPRRDRGARGSSATRGSAPSRSRGSCARWRSVAAASDVHARALYSGGQSDDAILSTVADALGGRGARVRRACRSRLRPRRLRAPPRRAIRPLHRMRRRLLRRLSAFARGPLPRGRPEQGALSARRRIGVASSSPSRPSSTSRIRGSSCARWRASSGREASSSSRPRTS